MKFTCACFISVYLNSGLIEYVIYDKRVDFNFPFICSNIAAIPALDISISNSNVFRAYVHYNDYLENAGSLTQKLLGQGYFAPRLKSSQHFYGRNHNPVDRYGISILEMKTDFFKPLRFRSKPLERLQAVVT